MIKPSVATVALRAISVENVISYDGLVLVSYDIRGLQLRDLWVSLVNAHDKLRSLYHIQGILVIWI